MAQDIPKAYEPQGVEDGIYAAWEQSGFFRPENLPNLDARREAFTIVLPPPNVTGTLHMGHAAMLAIEDIMIRFARMRGKRALWIPGTDHAAIATQTKVEKMLIEQGTKDPRRELGREAFLKRVKQFASHSHDTIVNQCKKMGASLDWSREAYTLDEARHRAVNAVFKMMFEDGLIYRGNRVINWCPRCQSTLADDEVEHKETTATLYTFRYDKNFPVAIATTRPETKLGDTAVAVHPSDDRYTTLLGKTVEATFVGKYLSLKIISDSGIDPQFGTGALGVTPSHSQIDAQMASMNDLPFVTVIGEDGRMTSEAGEAFVGLTTTEVREKMVSSLREAGLLEKEEEIAQNLSICYRCESAIEPLPKLQWFIDVDKPFRFRASTHVPIQGMQDGEQVTLKLLMQHVVRSGQIEIIPDRFVATYFRWIDNLRDWNISRQIWFGHRVPVWYRKEEMKGPKGTERAEMETFVGAEPPQGDGWEQDPDTLDTWFSAGLWTFSTLGWPDKTDELDIYHPTSVLETGYDIIFFWVARMILMTTYVLGEVPFREVYLHGLVRDEKGKKMSKSLGNVIDPLDMIKQYGADATRLSLVIGTTPGNDMKLSDEKVAGYRNFANKLWNIARFVLSSVEVVEIVKNGEGQTLADRWILGRFAETLQSVTQHLERHEFSAAGELLRDFTWSEFADWYLEIAKVQKGQETDKILLSILENLLALWHPFMPFVTEEIWKLFQKGDMMIVHAWPEVSGALSDETREQFDLIRDLIVAIRNIRAEFHVEPSREISVMLVGSEEALLQENAQIIKKLARVSDLHISATGEKPDAAACAVVRSTQVYVPLAGLMDAEKEKARLTKEFASAQSYAASLEQKLANVEFTSKAPASVVDGLKTKRAEAEEKFCSLKKQLETL